ncbi:MAG: ATP-binding cassette domain-containing protein [Kineosporiaceae bacterium]
MIVVEDLHKSYGGNHVLKGVTFQALPGRVTGFLGPNGAGKSTTMRQLVGLERPDSGIATINGRPAAQHQARLREVGALLDGRAALPGMTAIGYVRSVAATHGLGDRRADEALATVGLSSVAKKRIKGFSLGMGQRLGLAVALLGDPKTLILDEPVNGLDPDGVIWVREFLKHLASQGKCVLLSSHLMTEMAQTADDLVLIAKGKIITSGPLRDLLASEGASTQVRSDDPALAAAIQRAGGTVASTGDGALTVRGLDPRQVGQVAASAGIALVELRAVERTLEAAYLDLTRDATEFTSTPAATAAAHLTEGPR